MNQKIGMMVVFLSLINLVTALRISSLSRYHLKSRKTDPTEGSLLKDGASDPGDVFKVRAKEKEGVIDVAEKKIEETKQLIVQLEKQKEEFELESEHSAKYTKAEVKEKLKEANLELVRLEKWHLELHKEYNVLAAGNLKHEEHY
eukprot:Platyproteum_vivax@DN7389_c1_g8_i1.p1